MNYPTIISFYTNTWEYPKYANKLKQSCNNLGLEYNIEERKGTGNWLLNTRIKPKYILHCLETLKTPCLWIDVDGSLLKRPDVLVGVDADFAAKKKKKSEDRIWHVGTMFFNYTEKTLSFLNRWIEEIEKTQGSDELCLDRIWKQYNDEMGLKTLDLPAEYFEMLQNISDKPSTKTVIAHRASRCESKLEMKRRKKI